MKGVVQTQTPLHCNIVSRKHIATALRACALFKFLNNSVTSKKFSILLVIHLSVSVSQTVIVEYHYYITKRRHNDFPNVTTVSPPSTINKVQSLCNALWDKNVIQKQIFKKLFLVCMLAGL